jgi:hypothetical protein
MKDDHSAAIVLIDDNQELLAALEGELKDRLDGVQVAAWRPVADSDLRAEFDLRVGDDTVIVATDYDLTESGAKGLFGHTIMAWCQHLGVPAGDFSRQNADQLSKAINPFELRVPPDPAKGADFIASMYLGFVTLRNGIGQLDPDRDQQTGLAATLAAVLGRPHLESHLSLYLAQFGSATLAVAQELATRSEEGVSPAQDAPRTLTYVLGHLLANVVLRFPGPILNEDALCAYVATDLSEIEALATLFGAALYTGPFSTPRRYYWTESVDEVLETLASAISDDSYEGVGEFNRAVIEKRLGRTLAAHSCRRDGCEGTRGGFWCPHSSRTVCLRNDCSLSSSTWIPVGATVCRVEKDYHDEWAPLIGQ